MWSSRSTSLILSSLYPLPYLFPCQLDLSSPWSHPVVLTNDTIRHSPSHALNLVSFVLNFQLACTVCLLLSMYNTMALRCKSKQRKLYNPALKELPGSLIISDVECIFSDYWPSGEFLLHTVNTVSYCSWGSQGKNTEVVCHSFLQWTTFCQISPPWPAHLGLPQGHGLVSLS